MSTATKKAPTKAPKASHGKKGATPAPKPRKGTGAKPGKGKGKPAKPTEEQIQAVVTELVRDYGPAVKKWDHLPAVCAEKGIDPAAVTDERVLKAKETLEAADKKMKDGLKEANKSGRLKAVLKGDPELDPALNKDHPLNGHARKKDEGGEKGDKDKPARKPAGAPRAKAGGGLSLIEAAAKVLADEGRPMGTREMVELAEKRGYWTPGPGLTPWASLGASIYVSILRGGDECPFVKSGRGLFALKS